MHNTLCRGGSYPFIKENGGGGGVCSKSQLWYNKTNTWVKENEKVISMVCDGFHAFCSCFTTRLVRPDITVLVDWA